MSLVRRKSSCRGFGKHLEDIVGDWPPEKMPVAPQKTSNASRYIGPIFIPRSLFTVRRVHWLRARAQLMRWQEEVTLTGYEMQWTVRYFRQMSTKWVIPSDLSTPAQGTSASGGSGSGMPLHSLTGGAIAYWNRKKAVWEDLMKKADIVFQGCNPAYDSPL
jgi:hypothetical protein